MIAILISARLATPDLLKIKIVWNKVYNIVVFVFDITNKTL